MEKVIDGFDCINIQAELKPLVMAVKAPAQGWVLLQEIQPWEVLVLPTKPAAPSQLPAQGFCRAGQCAGCEAKGFACPPLLCRAAGRRLLDLCAGLGSTVWSPEQDRRAWGSSGLLWAPGTALVPRGELSLVAPTQRQESTSVG